MSKKFDSMTTLKGNAIVERAKRAARALIKGPEHEVKSTAAFQTEAQLHDGTRTTIYAQRLSMYVWNIALYNSQAENVALRRLDLRISELKALAELVKSLPDEQTPIS